LIEAGGGPQNAAQIASQIHDKIDLLTLSKGAAG
jgi:hypothetical protein